MKGIIRIYFAVILCLTLTAHLSYGAAQKEHKATQEGIQEKANPLGNFGGHISSSENLPKVIYHQDRVWDAGAVQNGGVSGGNKAERPNPVPASVLQGGDRLDDATVIPSLPFSDAGTTAGYANDYAGTCGTDEGAPDVVYSFVPANDMLVTVSLCGGSDWDTRLYIFLNDAQTEIACNDDACGTQSKLSGVQLSAQNTYYIVIDGFGSANGDYVLNVSEDLPCVVDCPPNAIPEGEPACGDDYVDNYNGGCNSNPPVFQDINVGDTICAVSGNYISNGFESRDTDWYRITVNERCYLNWDAVAQFRLQLLIIAPDENQCYNPFFLATGFANPCDTLKIECLVEPGTYYLWAGPLDYSGWNCPLPYTAWCTTHSAPPPPPNDNCVDVTPENLVRDVPLTFTGSSLGASLDCQDLGTAEVWIAFTTTEPLDITLDYCDTDPGWNFAYTVISDGCPCGTLYNASSFNTTDCPNGNYTVTFRNMAPGTYYYPVIYEENYGAVGPYTIHVNGTTSSCAADLQMVAPGSLTGNTCGAGNDCDMGQSEDQVIEVTVPYYGIWTFSTCGNAQWPILTYLGHYCCIADIILASNACDGNEGGQTMRAVLEPGIYYVMIEGNSFMDCGEYQLDITYEPPIELSCPPNAIPEGEQDCGDGYVDNYNGGCNSNPTVFQNISSGDTICGTSGTFDRVYRDTDWYRLVLTEPGSISWSAIAEFPLKLYIINPGSFDCRDFTLMAIGDAEPGENLTITAAAEPGEYWLWIAPSTFQAWGCPHDYIASVTVGNPDFSINPTAVTGSAPTGGSDSDTLTISNTGTGDLGYRIDVFETPHGLRFDRPLDPLPFTASGDKIAPRPANVLQGGDRIDDAMGIRRLPFNDAGTTSGYTNDYSGSCGIDAGAPDVVYFYAPANDINVDVSLCGGSNWNTRLYVFENNAETEIACNDDACGTQSSLSNVPLRAGNVYYFVVDGYGTESGDYTININENLGCQLECPVDAVPEGEPDCGPDYVDTYNSGCLSDPPVYGTLTDDVTICGTTGAYMGGRTPTRDTDWFIYWPTGPTFLTLTGAAEVGVVMGFIVPFDTNPCHNDGWITPYFLASPCDTGAVTLVADGSVPIIVFIAPDMPDLNYACGSKYWFHFSTDPIWLSTDVTTGIVPIGQSRDVVVSMDAENLVSGNYAGRLVITTNEVGPNVYEIPVTFNVSSGGCTYVIGDINGNGARNGLDVVYGVSYFKGGPFPPYSCECTPGNTWFVSGDVNGSCNFNGLDISYLVSYFKGGPQPIPCADCPPVEFLVPPIPIDQPAPAVQPVLRPVLKPRSGENASD